LKSDSVVLKIFTARLSGGVPAGARWTESLLSPRETSAASDASSSTEQFVSGALVFQYKF
jgi:hypothetical protein